MAIETATNCWTNAEAKIATALANSAKFREIVEAADATAAAAKIFGEQVARPNDGHVYTLEELQVMKAYAQVYSGDEGPYGRRFEANRMVAYGTAIIYIERLVTEYDQSNEVPASIERWFKNRVGDLMVQVESYLRETNGLLVKTFEVTAGPGLNERDTWKQMGMWQGIELTLEWGY
jgi:hypothetical protein